MQDNSLEIAELNLEWYTGSSGYDPQFLGPEVGLPTTSSELSLDRVPLTDGSGHELKYTHFSIVMSKSRRLAIFTAVNIDGKQLQEMPRGRDAWYFDPRIERNYHMDPRVYAHPDLDRGHLIRRLDPVWGEQAEAANEDTFHFTNCSPQHQALNRRTWLDLERYILDNAQVHELRVTVFTGPVFRDDDKIYSEEFAIPAEFWKVVVVVKTDGHLSATGYLQSQRDLITDLEAFTFGEYKTYQVPVSYVETVTGLDFGELRHHDPLTPVEEIAPRAQVVDGANDILL